MEILLQKLIAYNAYNKTLEPRRVEEKRSSNDVREGQMAQVLMWLLDKKNASAEVTGTKAAYSVEPFYKYLHMTLSHYPLKKIH